MKIENQEIKEQRKEGAEDENKRIIKLIRQKLYPLHLSEKSPLTFPKIKEKSYVSDPPLKQKRYIDIEIKEQRVIPQVIINPVPEPFDVKRKVKNIELSRKNSKQNIIDYLMARSQHYNKIIPDKKDQQMNNSKSSVYEAMRNQDFTSKQQAIIKQQIRHSQYLQKMKFLIGNSKKEFIEAVRLSETDREKQDDKQNFEHLVNRLCSKNKKLKMDDSLCAYQQESPNKLNEYLKIFKENKESEKTCLRLELAKLTFLTKSISQEEKEMDPFRIKNCNINTTIIEEEGGLVEDNILSAKLRIKNNHKKIIHLAMGNK